MNDAALKDLFRVQWDKLSQIDSEDHMSAGYRDILTQPRLCASEKLYPASWWSSFFFPLPLLCTPLKGQGEFMEGMTYQDKSYSGVFEYLWADMG